MMLRPLFFSYKTAAIDRPPMTTASTLVMTVVCLSVSSDFLQQSLTPSSMMIVAPALNKELRVLQRVIFEYGMFVATMHKAGLTTVICQFCQQFIHIFMLFVYHDIR